MEENSKHKCFISFKKEDNDYKKELVTKYGDQMINKSLEEPIDSEDEDYIMRKIREDHLSNSTVTIFLIGSHSNENLGSEEQKYIKRELQASLYDGDGNTRNGLLGIVLPSMTSSVYKGSYKCYTCMGTHNNVFINDNTVIKEFSKNYYIDNPSGKCCWQEKDRYCVLVKWEDFINNPQEYIQQAYDKRSADISKKVTVHPK
ncbi:MAG: TIR domain-containing protein [Bacteroidaceae bacterium]